MFEIAKRFHARLMVVSVQRANCVEVEEFLGFRSIVDPAPRVNFIGERESDIIVIEEIFSNFEDISGAILSRSEKSKVMGLCLGNQGS